MFVGGAMRLGETHARLLLLPPLPPSERFPAILRILVLKADFFFFSLPTHSLSFSHSPLPPPPPPP